jgi:hypothetical protein
MIVTQRRAINLNVKLAAQMAKALARELALKAQAASPN